MDKATIAMFKEQSERAEINRRRKRAIEKAEKEMDRYENWKEWVEAVGGSLQKGKDGKLHGVLHVE